MPYYGPMCGEYVESRLDKWLTKMLRCEPLGHYCFRRRNLVQINTGEVLAEYRCPKCKSMDTLDTEALTALSLDELRNKYPWVNWKDN